MSFVRLSDYSVQKGSIVGVARNNESILKGYKPRGCGSEDPRILGNHISGAVAELALCEWIGTNWDFSINKYNRESDIPGGIEVRSKLVSRNFMKLRPGCDSAKGEHIFVSLTRMYRDRLDVWRIDGWQWGKVIMAEPTVWVAYNDREKCEEWHIPESLLLDTNSLRDEMRRRLEIARQAEAMKHRFEEREYACGAQDTCAVEEVA